MKPATIKDIISFEDFGGLDIRGGHQGIDGESLQMIDQAASASLPCEATSQGVVGFSPRTSMRQFYVSCDLLILGQCRSSELDQASPSYHAPSQQ
jgi:hypothetical protein